jgi:hypothetical protein
VVSGDVTPNVLQMQGLDRIRFGDNVFRIAVLLEGVAVEINVIDFTAQGDLNF